MTAPTPRGRMSTKRRQHIFTENSKAHNLAPCCLCGRLIHRHNDVWIVEHKCALGLLGSDSNPNCAPAHEDCRRVKDKDDLSRIAKAKRQEAAGVAVKGGQHRNLSAAQVSNMGHAHIHSPENSGILSSKRSLRVPAGVAYNWQLRRYVRAGWDRTEGL